MQTSSSNGWSKPLSGSSSFPNRVESYLSSLTRSSARSSNLHTELCTASSMRASRSSRCFALPVFCGQHSKTRSDHGYRSLLPRAVPGNSRPFKGPQNGVRESSELGELPAVRFPPPPLLRCQQSTVSHARVSARPDSARRHSSSVRALLLRRTVSPPRARRVALRV